MSKAIKAYKERTVLVKRTGEKVVVDLPYELVEKAMATDVLKIGEKHTIRTKGINEWYASDITDALHAWIIETYPEDIQHQILAFRQDRIKTGGRINKEIIANYYTYFINKNK